jgi:hypothetical protein
MSDSTLFDLDPDAQQRALDHNMAKTLAERLHATYPNQLWGVNVEGRTGLITIRNLLLAGNWGYVMKLGAIYSMSALEADAVRAGGEILERFRMARGKFDADKWSSAPTDFAGRLLFDKS